MQVYKIDERGYYIEPVVLQEGEEITNDCVEIQPSQGLFKAKWTGTEWVEDMTQDEINTLNNQPKLPTTDDYLLDFEFRLSMLELGL